MLFVVPSAMAFRVSGFGAALAAAVTAAVVGGCFFVAPVGQVTVHAQGLRLLLLLLLGTGLLSLMTPPGFIRKPGRRTCTTLNRIRPGTHPGVSHLPTLAVAVIAVATFNLTFRLGQEHLAEWDESLYVTTAFEILESNDWIGTTFRGALDYSNSKPPLNVWLLALSMNAFGVSLVTLRLASVIAALLTVVVLLLWAWDRFGPRVGIFSALVLTTCFGFLHVHSSRSANPDALLTLLLLLIVVVLDSASARPGRRVWLGPLVAGVFLLKGMAVLLPLLLIAFMEWRRHSESNARWAPLLGAFVIAGIIVGAWAIARWQVDRWAFFKRIFFQDCVALSTTVLDGQSGSVLYYLNILQKHHYDWLVAMAVVLALFPPDSWPRVTKSLMFWRSENDRTALVGAWSVITILVPTLMQTKLPWYLNPFYPMFALGAGWILNHAVSRARRAPIRRRALFVALIVLASVVAEAKLIYYSYAYRALNTSAQGLLLLEADRVRGGRVFRNSWTRADAIILKAIVRAEPAESISVEDFVGRSASGDYLLASEEVERPELARRGAAGNFVLLQKRN